MLKNEVEMELRDLGKQPLSEAELDALIGKRDFLQFLNPRNEMYCARKIKAKPPSRAEAIRLMAKNPNLIRRPIAVSDSRMVIGYDEKALGEID